MLTDLIEEVLCYLIVSSKTEIIIVKIVLVIKENETCGHTYRGKQRRKKCLIYLRTHSVQAGSNEIDTYADGVDVVIVTSDYVIAASVFWNRNFDILHTFSAASG